MTEEERQAVDLARSAVAQVLQHAHQLDAYLEDDDPLRASRSAGALRTAVNKLHASTNTLGRLLVAGGL